MENWMELRNRLFQEDHARDCQEIEELRGACCEETDRARQARIDELSLHQERNFYDSGSIIGSNSGVTEQNQFHVRCEGIFTILNQGAALERPTFLIGILLF